MPVTEYTWDPVSDSILEETDGAGTVTASYTNEPSAYGPLISQHRDGESRFFHFDALGSTRELTDDNEDVTDSFTYDAWGNQVERTGATETAFRWVGRKGYQTTDLFHYINVRNRTYRILSGQWISKDRIWPADGLNTHRYAFNSPALLLDASGQRTVEGPLATIVSWIDIFDPHSLDILDIIDRYTDATGRTLSTDLVLRLTTAIEELAASANPRPPESFTSASWTAFVAAKEYRGYLEYLVEICCPNAHANVTSASIKQQDNSFGWTPIRPLNGPTLTYLGGEGYLTTTGPDTGAPCATATILSAMRLGWLGQVFSKLLTGVGPPYVTSQIKYELCCSGQFTVEFKGSHFPSHRGYIWRNNVGQRLQTDLPGFMFAGNSVLVTPVDVAVSSGTGNIR